MISRPWLSLLVSIETSESLSIRSHASCSFPLTTPAIVALARPEPIF